MFYSILFDGDPGITGTKSAEPPDFFSDLNLDQVLDSIVAGREEYDLKPLFYEWLGSPGAVNYRQEIMRDLESAAVSAAINAFCQDMRGMREDLASAGKSYHKFQKEWWFLHAVEKYCQAVKDLLRGLACAVPRSKGLLDLSRYLQDYTTSQDFLSLVDGTRRINDELAEVSYCMLLRGNAVTVRQYDEEIDYSTDILSVFEKFAQGAAKNHLVDFPEQFHMNQVEMNVLDLVAKLHPETFNDLDGFCSKNADYADERIRRFDREIQFYLSYLEYIAKIKKLGLSFCYPVVSDDSKTVFNKDGFDLALAYKCVVERSTVVCNDFLLDERERVFVISGPNQGGKTTFARAFGQMHYLAAIGCPVPGSDAALFLADRLFTHFEREENIKNLRSKLEDDLVRIHNILSQATPRSIVVMNEIFSSTTLRDAVSLSKKTMLAIVNLDVLCVFVTFMDEVASLSDKIVSMVSTVVPENTQLRTYKIVRRPADGLAYALSIAEKYRLTYQMLRERIKP